MQNERSKIFISSTGVDLAEYRRAAIEVCNQLQFVPIAMEFFDSMGAGANSASKIRLDDAHLYVGIVAHRYGYIEPGYDKSVTENEFDYAGEVGLDRLCFLVDDKQPWPPEAIEFRAYSLLKEFRARIERSVVRSLITTVDDFRAKLMSSLIQWRDRARPGSHSAQAIRPLESVWIAPGAPPLFVGRIRDAVLLKRKLGVPSHERPQPVTVLRGWPGVGKSALVSWLVYDSEVNKHFSDGVLWAHLGAAATADKDHQETHRRQLFGWAHELQVEVRGDSEIGILQTRIRAALQARHVLVVLDDAWSTADVATFLLGGVHCGTLVTTRLTRVASEIAPTPQDVYVVPPLGPEDAFDLLSRLAPSFSVQFHERAKLLLEQLEGLPLSIRVAARLVETEMARGLDLDRLLADLSEGQKLLGEVAPPDRFDPATGVIPTLSLLLQRSTHHLDPVERDRFAYLGVFAPKPATFDVAAMQRIWQVRDVVTTAAKLADRGLLEPLVGTGRFQMHSLLVAHAKSMLREY